MDPLPTLDVLLSDPATGKDRLTRAVESAIAAALAELSAVEAFDKATAPDLYQFDRPVAAAVRHLFEGWVSTAEPLGARVAAAVGLAGPMRGADKLEYAVGKTMARLSITLDDHEQSLRDVVEGRTISLEELRRELRLPAKV